MKIGLNVFLLTFLSFASIFADNVSSNADVLLQRTIEYAQGHREFRNLSFKEHEKEFVKLAQEGQFPKTLFIGCSDSRVIPELISASTPGQLFVIRTAGNFVPYYNPSIAWDGVAATIQYAVEVLGVVDIIVCGHSHCGAIEGLFADVKLNLLANWLRFGYQAKRLTLLTLGDKVHNEAKCDVAEHLSILFQLDHLLTYPFIKEKVNEQKLHLHGWHFDIQTAQIDYYDPVSMKFLPLKSVLESVGK